MALGPAKRNLSDDPPIAAEPAAAQVGPCLTRGREVLDSAGFEILDQAECFALLEKTRLGRVAVTIGALPAIFPVNFCIVAGQVVFRSGEGPS